MSYFERVHRQTPTRFWVNNVTRAQVRLAIEAGAVSCTQNPAYLSKVIGSADDGEWIDSIIEGLLPTYPSDGELTSELQRHVIAGICQEFLPLYRQSQGRQGLVSIQADPFHEDTQTILSNADACARMMPNFLIKIPATKDGIEAIGTLIKARIPVLATEVMSMDQVIELLELHKRLTGGLDAPAPFWFAHINGIFDEHLEETAKNERIGIRPEALKCASFALARRIHEYMRQSNSRAHYLAGGARGLHHFTDMVGVDGGVTINWTGTADRLIDLDGQVKTPFDEPIPQDLIDELSAKMPDFQKAYQPGSLTTAQYELFGPVVRFRNMFEEGWQSAVSYIASRR